jgi:hypothetical protein
MAIKLSTIEARRRFGEALKGQPLTTLVPISALEDIKLKAAKDIEAYFSSSKSDLSDEEAMKIANEEIKQYRLEKKCSLHFFKNI